MPVYEYYCGPCHTIYNFRVQSPRAGQQPACPQCGHAELVKQISLFAISKGRDAQAEDDLPPMDEVAMEQAMSALESEASTLDEENPRAMAQFMRRMYESTGLKLGGGMEEAIRRMEAGEDPDRIEAEMGDTLENDELLFATKTGQGMLKEIKQKLLPPRVDETLYDFDETGS